MPDSARRIPYDRLNPDNSQGQAQTSFVNAYSDAQHLPNDS
jgi:hypothetical protein